MPPMQSAPDTQRKHHAAREHAVPAVAPESGCRSGMSVETLVEQALHRPGAKADAGVTSPSSRKSSSPTGTSPSPRPPASTTPRTAFPSCLRHAVRAGGDRRHRPAAPAQPAVERRLRRRRGLLGRLRPRRAGRDRLRADRPEPLAGRHGRANGAPARPRDDPGARADRSDPRSWTGRPQRGRGRARRQPQPRVPARPTRFRAPGKRAA